MREQQERTSQAIHLERWMSEAQAKAYESVLADIQNLEKRGARAETILDLIKTRLSERAQ